MHAPFGPNQASKTFTVSITNDTLDDANETVNLSLVNPTGGAALGTPVAAVLTILDNDLSPKLAVNNAVVTEGDSGSLNATFTVTLSAASGQTVTVNYATADGTATAAGDYVSETGTVTFTAGQVTRTIVIAVRGDLLKETNETFFVNLSGATNATIADAQGKVTILNDD